ncbi:MAG: glycoside hydrolase family 13 protein [Acholeplasmataceae bacterium]|nr:glycoside hydrolase family 13 protein [Acholeplasmataceae bacterium]
MYHKFFHQPKSNYAYLYDRETLHLWLKTTKEFQKVKVIYGDPFNYQPLDETLTKWEWVNENKNTTMEKRLSDDYYNYFFVSLKPSIKRIKYAFLIDEQFLYGTREIIDLKKEPQHLNDLFNYFNFPYLHQSDLIKVPSWTKRMVWYQIFPDRFYRPQTNINKNISPWPTKDEKITNEVLLGGNLKGITEKLPYLADLGITGLYLTPLFKSPSIHKYDTTDYFEIDPSFGTKADLKTLINKAHALKIKVVLDGVFNHSGYLHPFWQDVLKKGKKSKYYHCFFLDKDAHINFELTKDKLPKHQIGLKPPYETFAFTPRMPKWNVDHPLTQQHLLAVASYWLKEFNIDGWRLDVANEVSHSFWRLFRKTVKNINPEAFIFGENWDFASPWLQGEQFDAVMNYQLSYSLWQYLDNYDSIKKITASEFRRIINNIITAYPLQITEAMFNLVESHDTERVLNRAGNNLDLAFLYYLFLFSFPGSPSLYYGGELALGGGGDPDSRRAMPWQDGNYQFLQEIKWLINLRKNEKSFAASNFKFIYSDDNSNIIGYQTKKDKESITIFINPTNNNCTINYSLSGVNLKTQEKVTLKNFNLFPFSYLIVKTFF